MNRVSIHGTRPWLQRTQQVKRHHSLRYSFFNASRALISIFQQNRVATMLSEVLRSVLLSLRLASAIIPLTALYLIYTHVTQPLSKIPPIHWSARFSSAHILYTKFFCGVRSTHYNAHLNRIPGGEFRPVLRVGPNEVSIMSIQGVETVFTGGYERGPWYDVFSNFGYVGTMSWQRLKARHTQLKSIESLAFHGSSHRELICPTPM